MFSAVPMVRVRIQVPGHDAAAATHAIARLGLLHLIDIGHGRADSAPAASDGLLAAHRALRDRCRRVLDRLGAIAPIDAPDVDTPITDFDVERQRIAAALEPVEAAVDRAWADREEALAAAGALDRTLTRAKAFAQSGLDPSGLLELRFAAARILTTASEEALSSLAGFLSPTPHRLEVIDAAAPLSIALTPASAATRLDAALRLVHLDSVPPAEVAGADRVEQLQSSRDDARRRAAAAGEALASLAQTHAADLRPWLRRAEICVLLLQAQGQFGATGRFVVISGWIPESDAARLQTALAAAAPRAIVDIERPAAGVEAPAGVAGVPILHRNPVLLRPFEPLIEMYDTPSYRELQPTAFFAVSFLIMFGLMFGDVGHGAVLAIAGYYLFRYMPRFLDYGILLMEAGAASALFGVLYGSLFGIPGALPVLWLEPARDLPTFMRVAVMFGVVLVSAGLLLNVVNSWRMGQRASALVGIRGLFGAFLYWTAIAIVIRTFLSSSVVVPAWLLATLALGAVLLIVARAPIVRWLDRGRGRPGGPRPPVWLTALEGSVELVDSLFTYFANTISFVRIAAFAAVHAGVFVAMFAVADTLARTRLGSPLAVAALVVGNVVLILLEGLTVSVQVLRLEYYEFFGKFFRGGGQQFQPLMLRTTQEKEGSS